MSLWQIKCIFLDFITLLLMENKEGLTINRVTNENY